MPSIEFSPPDRAFTTGESRASPSSAPPFWGNQPLLPVLAVFALVLVSNTWLGWESGIDLLHAVDVYSYEIIAESAPQLPSTTGDEISFQYGQRFVYHYIIGIVAKLTSLPLPVVYHGGVLATLILLTAAVARIVSEVGLTGFRSCVCVVLLVVNPYVIRYYLVVPGMIADVLFALFMAVTILGLLRKQIGIVLCGVLLAVLARQTQLLALPGLVLWMVAGANWSDDSVKRKTLNVATLVGVHAVAYFVSSRVAEPFTYPVADFHLYYSVYTYFVLEFDKLLALAEHILRIGIPHLMTGLFLGVAYAKIRKSVSWKSLPAEFWACLIMVVSLAAQPFLMEPEYATHGQARHSSLALVAAITALALFFREYETHLRFRFSKRLGVLFFTLLFLSSLHHMTSVSPLTTPVQYAVYHFLIAGSCAYIFGKMMFRENQRSDDSAAPSKFS